MNDDIDIIAALIIVAHADDDNHNRSRDMMKSELLAEYRPYNTMPEFHEGWDDYMAGANKAWPHDHYSEVKAQAYDRGQEAAMRWRRQGHE